MQSVLGGATAIVILLWFALLQSCLTLLRKITSNSSHPTGSQNLGVREVVIHDAETPCSSDAHSVQ